MAADAAGWLVKWLQMQLGVALGHSMWLAMAPCAGSKTVGLQSWGGGWGGPALVFLGFYCIYLIVICFLLGFLLVFIVLYWFFIGFLLVFIGFYWLFIGLFLRGGGRTGALVKHAGCHRAYW